MDAVTYPHGKVIEFIHNHLIPVRLGPDSPHLYKEFNVTKTPTLSVVGPEGDEHHRAIGFLLDDELIPSLELGISKGYLDNDRLDQALKAVQNLLADYPQSDVAPEAVFLRGILRYKKSLDHKYFKEAYEQIKADYPSSEWIIHSRMLYRYPCALVKWETRKDKKNIYSKGKWFDY